MYRRATLCAPCAESHCSGRLVIKKMEFWYSGVRRRHTTALTQDVWKDAFNSSGSLLAMMRAVYGEDLSMPAAAERGSRHLCTLLNGNA